MNFLAYNLICYIFDSWAKKIETLAKKIPLITPTKNFSPIKDNFYEEIFSKRFFNFWWIFIIDKLDV